MMASALGREFTNVLNPLMQAAVAGSFLTASELPLHTREPQTP
jgi:hypothetical protein